MAMHYHYVQVSDEDIYIKVRPIWILRHESFTLEQFEGVKSNTTTYKYVFSR